jgi:hypothetical protein
MGGWDKGAADGRRALGITSHLAVGGLGIRHLGHQCQFGRETGIARGRWQRPVQNIFHLYQPIYPMQVMPVEWAQVHFNNNPHRE